MSGLFLLAQTESGGQIEQIAQRFGVDWSHLIAQTISFCIVAALLYRFAYHPVLTMLEERRKSIAEGLAAAEQNKAHLAETQAQREQVIAEANEQANRLIEEARNSAARIRDQKVQQAVAEAEQIVAKLRQAEVEFSTGQKTPQVCKKHGVSEQIYYRWRREYGA